MLYENEIRVAFPITTTQTSFKEELDGERTIREVAEIIFDKAGQQADGTGTDTGYLEALRKASESYRLIDRTKRVLDIKTDFYRAYIQDKVQFLAAKVIDMEVYGNKNCYIKVEFAGRDKIYNGTVVIAAETYYRLFDEKRIDERKNIYLIGTCVRKEYKVGERKRWNKYTRGMQKISDATTRKKTRMLHFYMGNAISGSAAGSGRRWE